MSDAVTTYTIRLPRHRAANVRPKTLARSWGSKIPAPAAVEKMFGCIPFPWNLYVDVQDTPEGLAKRLGRMHAPERLFAARQDRIRKRLQEKDPMFYDQLIGPMLTNDVYDLGYYRRRQRQIADMHRKIAVNPEQVGRLWVNPDAQRLTQFDWPAMALELRDLVIGKIDVYDAQDQILEKHGVK